MILRWGPREGLFRMSEVPMYGVFSPEQECMGRWCDFKAAVFCVLTRIHAILCSYQNTNARGAGAI